MQAPTENLNALNQVIPSLINSFTEAESSKEKMRVLKQVDKLIKKFHDQDIIQQKESVLIIKPREHQASTDKVSLFVSQRISALLQALSAQVDSKTFGAIFEIVASFVQRSVQTEEQPQEKLNMILECPQLTTLVERALLAHGKSLQ